MFPVDRQADLDDLVASCRSDNTRRAFGEAIACFRAGAYRSCIVATWTAVIFDYLGKLRDLEIAGNKDAKLVLDAFENARQRNDIPTLQRLEGEVLAEAASKFELLSPIEKEDLERLRIDRHRCAHPSMMTLDEPYQPTAELARAHMRNAAQHLLSHLPIQGKEACARIWSDVISEYFPDTTAAAVERLSTRVSRVRASVIRQVAIDLSKRLLSELSEEDQVRSRAALSALCELQHAEVERLLRAKLDAVADGVSDSDLGRLVSYCRHIGLAWGALGAATKNRLAHYVERTSSPVAIGDALYVEALQPIALSRLSAVDDKTLVSISAETERTEALDEIVTRFESRTSYTTFRDLRPAFEMNTLNARWTLRQKIRLITTLKSNSSLRTYMGFNGTVIELFSLTERDQDATRPEWKAVYDSIDSDYLKGVIRERFPDFETQ